MLWPGGGGGGGGGAGALFMLFDPRLTTINIKTWTMCYIVVTYKQKQTTQQYAGKRKFSYE